MDNAVQGVERLWKDCGLHFSTRYFRFLKWENAINTCGEKLVLALGKHVDNCAENLKVSPGQMSRWNLDDNRYYIAFVGGKGVTILNLVS